MNPIDEFNTLTLAATLILEPEAWCPSRSISYEPWLTAGWTRA